MNILKLLFKEIPIILASLILTDFIYLAAKAEEWTVAGILSLVFILIVFPKVKNFKLTKSSISVNDKKL